MIQVYSSPDLNDAYAVKDLLEENGISTHIFNENVNQLPGALFRATPDAWPAVHIDDESRFHEAKVLIQTFEKSERSDEAESGTEQPPWICPKCKEENADTFEICWKCGKPR